jgi:hypothetical protein
MLAKKDWFSLYRADDVIDDVTRIDGVERGQFRLHPKGLAGRSEGCITLESKNDFEKIRQRLLNNEKRLIPGTNIQYYGTIEVR